MALSPLTCTGCGAPLDDEVDGPVLRCAYCGQNHRVAQPTGVGVPAALPQVRAPASSQRAPVVAVVVALTVAVAGVGAMFALRGGAAPSQSVTQAGAEGPGDARTRYVEGQAVDVYWGASWWPGTIKRVHGEGSYRIGYDGWAASWDEDVTPGRLRRREGSVAAPAASPAR